MVSLRDFEYLVRADEALTIVLDKSSVSDWAIAKALDEAIASDVTDTVRGAERGISFLHSKGLVRPDITIRTESNVDYLVVTFVRKEPEIIKPLSTEDMAIVIEQEQRESDLEDVPSCDPLSLFDQP